MNKLMTNLSIWLTFIVILIDKTNGAIKCYECFVQPKRTANKTIDKPCTRFDESRDYEVDCPYSTMCMKKTYRLELLDGTIQETTERGCAQQKYDYMNYVNSKWQKQVTVEEPYTEGCLKQKEGSDYCHCRGSLCNSVGKIESNSYLISGIDTMSIIVVYNLVKYFRSMDYL